MPMKVSGTKPSLRKTPGFAARTLFGIWLGFMIATAGLALYPRFGQVSGQILCRGTMQLDTRHYHPAPGTSVTTRDFLCADNGRIGVGRMMLTTWLVYTLAIVALVELVTLLGRLFPPVGSFAAQAGLFLLLFGTAVAVALNRTAPLGDYPSAQTAAQPAGAAKKIAGNPVLPGLPHACEVITDEIAKKAIGESAHVTRRAQPNPHETQCLYVGDGGSINLMVGDWPTIHRSSSFFGDEQPVAGIGDEAYLSKMHQLVVRKGDRGFELGMTGPAGEYRGKEADDQIARGINAAKKLAPELAGRL